MQRSATQPQNGFTLIELITVVAITGMMLAIGIPAMMSWVRDNQLRSAAESVQGGLRLARATAIGKHRNVRFSLTDGLGSSCARDANTAAAWIVSIGDPEKSCATTLSNPATQLPSGDAANVLFAKWTVKEKAAIAVLDGNGNSMLQFDSLGRSLIGGLPTAIAIDVRDRKDKDDQCTSRCLRVMVSASGQVSTCDPNLPAGKLGACLANGGTTSAGT